MNVSVKRLHDAVSGIIKGKSDVIRYAIGSLLAKGHLLIEDVPGVGKTTLAFSLAKAIDCAFQRVQFTSDLLPSDIIGVNIYNPETREFEFRQGPLFSNIVLADEINRTSPKTQSALLEAMSERRVSVERKTYHLPEPFMVIATENPMEYHGTFPLPESQLDRFMMHLKIGYPEPDYEKEVLTDMLEFETIERMDHVLTGSDIVRIQKDVSGLRMNSDVLDYILEIVQRTRNDERIRLGVSTRGAQFLMKASQAIAYIYGRDYILPEDVKEVAPLVLGHRIILKSRTYFSDADEIIRDIAGQVPVPM